MFCPDCGSQVAEDRRFCGKCGAGLGADAARGAATAPYAPETPAVMATPAPERPASLRSKVVYALVAVLMVLGGVGWWWFHRPAPAYKVQDPGIYPFQGLSVDGQTVKWGFIDADGKVLVQPEWDATDVSVVMGQSIYCSEGFCGVQKNGKWGYVDTSGKLVIPNQFDSVGPFTEGLARVNLGNQTGYIDKTGQYVINPQFSGAGDFHEALAAVHADAGWGFINKSGVFVIKPQFQAVSTDGFSDGLAGGCSGEHSLFGIVAGKCGYISRNGTFVVKPQFDSVGDFSEGLAAVQINGKWGYINSAGKIVINPQFSSTTMFSGGLAVVSISGKTGTINKLGKFVVNPGQFNIQPREGDLQPVIFDDGVGILTRDGKWIVNPTKGVLNISAILGKVFYATVGEHNVPISMSGKVLAGQYAGSMIATLAQDIQNQANALQSVRALVSAEVSYSSNYPAKGFTAALAALGPATSTPNENLAGLIDAALATGTKDGYQFAVSIPAGTSINGANFNYFVVAKAAAGHAGRTFCADSSGAIHYTAQGEECTVASPTL
jgi:hypothetical protein